MFNNSEDFGKLFEESWSGTATPGSFSKGTIIKKLDDRFILDIKAPAEAIMYFKDTKDVSSLSVGDEIEVRIKRNNDDKNGYETIITCTNKTYSSNKNKGYSKNINLKSIDDISDTIKNAYKNEEIVEGKIVEELNNGYKVLIENEFFYLPKIKIQEFKIDQIIECIIKKLEPKYNNGTVGVVFISMNNFNKSKQSELLKELKVDSIYNVKVIKVDKDKVLVETNGVYGYIRIKDLSYDYIDDINDFVKIGDEFDAVLIEKNEQRAFFSKKKLMKNKFEIFLEKNPIGSIVDGKVVKVNENGYILELEKNILGLLLNNQLSHKIYECKQTKLSEGDSIKVKILEANKSNRIFLSVKEITKNPWDSVLIKEGDIVEGKVVHFDHPGIVISVQNVEGFIPTSLSNMSFETIKNKIKINETILKGKVVSVDLANKVLKISIKDLKENIENEN